MFKSFSHLSGIYRANGYFSFPFRKIFKNFSFLNLDLTFGLYNRHITVFRILQKMRIIKTLFYGVKILV